MMLQVFGMNIYAYRLRIICLKRTKSPYILTGILGSISYDKAKSLSKKLGATSLIALSITKDCIQKLIPTIYIFFHMAIFLPYQEYFSREIIFQIRFWSSQEYRR